MTMKPSEKESSDDPTTTAKRSKPPPPTLSKRQRHAAGPNPSNTWQQQPQIKSAGARARAYIAYAGLADDDDDDDVGDDGENGDNSNVVAGEQLTSHSSSTKKKKSSRANSAAAKLLLDPQIDLNSPEVKFGRMLGGNDQRKRHEAVKMLRSYLTSRADFTKGGVGFSQLDFLKLWKGLWYTLYMADKAPVQDKLSKVLAELMWCLAGTEEEDEYAGEVFLEMEGDSEYFGDDSDEVEEEYIDGIGDGVFEDDDGDTMEIIDMEENSDDNDEEEGVEGEEEVEDDGDEDDEEYNSDDDEFVDEDDEADYEDDEDEIDEEEQQIEDMNEKHCRGAHLVCLYISTFLSTMRREWGNVDKHRVDKFYTAVRLMISEAYKYMSRRGWNIGIIHLFNDVLYEEGLSAETPGLTNGLRYHLIDICIDELAKVNKDAKVPLTEATFLDCIEPFFVLAQRAVDKNVQKRVMDNVLLKFLIEYSFVSTIAIEDDVEDDEKSLIFDQVHVGTVSKFIFQIASDVDTDDRFRKSLYEMHKTYERQIKTAGRDVEDVQYCVEIDDEVNGDDDCGDENNPNSDDMQSSVAGGENGENEAAIDQTSHENDEASKPTTLASTEKKKRKKKKKRDEIATVDSVVDEIADLGDGTVIDISTPRKSSSKKKKRKSDENLKDDNDVEVHEPAPRSEKVEKRNISSITSKSSKKQKMKQDVVPTENHSHLVTSHVETPAPNAKKKKINSPPSVDPRSMHSLDQITSPESDGAGISPSRRVSFGATNQCKSHKASMKAVKTLEKERWDTRRTPEKSILRPRSTEKKKSKSQLTGQSSSRKKRGVRKLDNE